MSELVREVREFVNEIQRAIHQARKGRYSLRDVSRVAMQQIQANYDLDRQALDFDKMTTEETT